MRYSSVIPQLDTMEEMVVDRDYKPHVTWYYGDFFEAHVRAYREMPTAYTWTPYIQGGWKEYRCQEDVVISAHMCHHHAVMSINNMLKLVEGGPYRVCINKRRIPVRARRIIIISLKAPTEAYMDRDVVTDPRGLEEKLDRLRKAIDHVEHLPASTEKAQSYRRMSSFRKRSFESMEEEDLAKDEEQSGFTVEGPPGGRGVLIGDSSVCEHGREDMMEKQ